LLVLFGNLAWSRFRGAATGPDPFGGGTLEWATTSPPPAYNFAVLPTVASPYPNWDRKEGEAGAGEGLVLDEGHETTATTVRDGLLDDILEMPSDSPWPIVLAACVTASFALVLVSHYAVAGIFAALAALSLAAWHSEEPAEASQ
jgi:cytochrome c oxidase subunit 1/cytochrome c oxidase subunit I+III